MNRAVVLGMIHESGPISRAEIAERTTLSPATVTGITGELITQGLVYEQAAGPSTGGRPPVLLSINRAAGCVVGIKLTESQIIATLTDLGAETLAQRTVSIASDRSPDGVVEQIVGLVDELRSGQPERQLYGVGLGMAGAIDRRAGICRFSPFLHWRDVPLGPMLEARIDAPIVIENDVSALTLAERWFGRGAGVADFVVVTLGRGVGLGMVLDGRLYRGGSGAGGEFGHVCVDPDGPRCACGKRGCLEAMIGEEGLSSEVRATLGADITLTDAAESARAGEDAARHLFSRAGRTLGVALSGVINVLNPRRMIVGGEGVQTLDLLFEPMRAALAEHCFDGVFDDLELVVEPWGDDAWARGAAGLILDDLFHARLDRDDARVAVS